MSTPGRVCRVNNKVYYEGESFQRGCMDVCTCLSGKLVCVPTCPTTIRAAAPKNCKHPRLNRRKNPCCLQWTCDSPLNRSIPVAYHSAPTFHHSAPVNGHSAPVVGPAYLAVSAESFRTDSRFYSTHKVRRHRERSISSRAHPLSTVHKYSEIVVGGKLATCVPEETEWSSCSKTCGWGLSHKYSNDNADCKKRKLTRFCQIRPCDVDLKPKRKRGKKCQRVVRAPRRVRFSYKGCKSKSFVPKYCGQCNDERCCQVKNHVTESINFRCGDGSSFVR